MKKLFLILIVVVFILGFETWGDFYVIYDQKSKIENLTKEIDTLTKERNKFAVEYIKAAEMAFLYHDKCFYLKDKLDSIYKRPREKWTKLSRK